MHYLYSTSSIDDNKTETQILSDIGFNTRIRTLALQITDSLMNHRTIQGHGKCFRPNKKLYIYYLCLLLFIIFTIIFVYRSLIRLCDE